MGSGSSSARTSEPHGVECEVSLGSERHTVQCTTATTCREFRELAAAVTGLKVEHHRVIHRGKELPLSDAPLSEFGLRAKGNRFVMRHSELFYRTEDAISTLTKQVDALEEQFKELGGVVAECTRAADDASSSELVARRRQLFLIVNESATQMLIKLDGVAADGDLRALRKAQVQRVVAMADRLDQWRAECVPPTPAP